MKKLTLLLFLIVLYGCSTNINKFFDQNKYVNNYTIHIINDSLQLYFKTPSDITYVTNKKELQKIIKNNTFKLKGDVLIYGKTDDPPYEYFVILPKNRKQKYPNNLVVFDTLINNQIIQFVGNSLSNNSQKSLEIDLKKIFESLEVGTNYRKEIITVMDVVNNSQESNTFLETLHNINQIPTYDKAEEWMKLQMQLTYSSFLGNNTLYNNYLSQLESRFKPNDTITTIIKNNLITDTKAIDTIIKQAAKHKIVMINENHYYPNHRLLVLDLLEDLQKIGYTHLALEALAIEQDSLLNIENAYPTLKTGFYTSEQNYSNLIRKAKELGYKFVAYESTNQTKDREINQAENLYNKTFKIEPNSKVLVLAGIDHILEKPTNSGKKWMATVFKENYNIDPLTISQTHLNLYRKEINNTIGILNSNTFNNNTLNSVDYLIINNQQIETTNNTFTYKNKLDDDIQIALFYTNEITSTNDFYKKIPYFTTIINGNETYNLPIKKDQKVILYAIDKYGKLIDKIIY